MEANPNEDSNGFVNDPYAADDLEPVEMDMENSDEEAVGTEQNGDSHQSLEQHDDITSHFTEHNNNSQIQNDNGDDNSNHHENHKIDHHIQRADRVFADGDYDLDDDKIVNQSGYYTNDSNPIRQREPKIIQVVNVAPSANLEQMKKFFGFMGDIVNIELYQSDDENPEINFKVCFIEFAKSSSVSLAQHLTNTVFIDRALIVLPYQSHEIPPKETALEIGAGSKYKTNFDFGVVSHITTGPGGIQSISTVNPRLTALGLAQYPQLPITTDPIRLEEIRRTVYIGNLDSTLKPDQVLKFFNDIGEVKYIRMAGDDTQPTRFAFVEYTNQSSVANAIQQNGFLLGSRALKINHSNNAIVKPQPKIEPLDGTSRRLRDARSSSRDRHGSSRGARDRRYDKDRGRRDRDRDRYYDSHRRDSPPSRSARRSVKSRDREVPSSRRISRERSSSRRSRSPRDRSSKRRSRSRESKKRRTSRSPNERSSSKHNHKRSRR